jgi:hypothetical protein
LQCKAANAPVLKMLKVEKYKKVNTNHAAHIDWIVSEREKREGRATHKLKIEKKFGIN